MTTLAPAAIVGWAWRTPLGDQIDEVMARVMRADSGIGLLSQVMGPEHGYSAKLAAMIPTEPARSRHQRFARRLDLFGVEAALEAASMAGVAPSSRVGVFVGYGGLRAHWDEMMPSLKGQRADLKGLWEHGFRDFHPFWMLRHLSNNAHAIAAAELGATGEGLTLGGANGGAQALAAAQLALSQRRVDIAVVSAYDSLVQPDVLVELGSSGALSLAATPDALRPAYDARASGRVVSEGAACVVLMRPEDAPQALGLVRAFDGADGSRYAPSAQALTELLERERLGAVDAVDGASQADVALDAAEREALGRLFGQDVALTSLASCWGDMGAASAVAQVIALTWCMRRGLLPPMSRLEQGEPPSMKLPLVPVTLATSPRPATRALGLTLAAPGLIGVICVEQDL